MLEAERDTQGRAITAALDRATLRERLTVLAREAGKTELRRMLEVVDDPARGAEAVRDAVSTRLMEVFRANTSRGAFGLLYELNSQHLLMQVAGCLRRYGSRTDPRDVLQEVFFNVYRYPHRFNSEREDAFRVWSAMIVRNTVLKHLRSQGRAGRTEVPFEDLSDQPEERVPTPVGGAIDRESSAECGRVYLTYLHLYLRFYSLLSVRERRAIHMVEVEEKSYREAAEDLGIKLENLKMVIFRARRKIHRSMRRVFEGLPPDCRPARDPQGGRRIAAGGALDSDGLGEEHDSDTDQAATGRGPRGERT
jgi:RNA polymerase sigma factor (sigma-70 family)